MSLRCFVAMAFDNADTDDWYDNTLTPLLTSVGATVRRVDRIEHNDDIDDKIIEEIRAADFMVADLTYARPSVYFEAGFAQRQIPVVYTVRADHFAPQPDAPQLKVHFDLAMRNIIAWRTPRDAQFTKRMKARVTQVIAPIVKANEAAALAKGQADAFERLSLANKKQAVLDGVIATLERSGVRPIHLEGTNASFFEGSKFRDSTLWGVQGAWGEGFTAAEIRSHMTGRMNRPRFNLQVPRHEDVIEQVRDIYVFASLRPEPWSRCTSALSVLSPLDPATKHFRYVDVENWPSSRVDTYRRVTLRPGYDHQFIGTTSGGREVMLDEDVDEDGNGLESVQRRLDVVFIDNIKSVESMIVRLTLAIELWRDELAAV